MAVIKSGATSDQLTVDATSKAARVTLYDTAGNLLAKQDKLASGITPGTTEGLLMVGADERTPRLMRLRSDGSIPTGTQLTFMDCIEGSALNTNLWTNTNTTMTISQATGYILLNAGSSVATTVGSILYSNKSFSLTPRGRIIYRARVRNTAHYSNNLLELGLSSLQSATAAGVATGAVWRKDGTGQYVPVISPVNGTETLGTPISDGTFRAFVAVTDYALFEVEICAPYCIFRILTAGGVLINEQTLSLAASSQGFQATHVNAMVRNYNAGATGTAVQTYIGAVAVYIADHDMCKPWQQIMSSMALNSLASPTAYTQLANWSNSAAPTTRTLANGSAAESTLGGLLVANSMAGGATDLIMFGWANPAPYNFYFTGIRFDPPLNQVVAVATTATVFIYGMSINCTAPANLGSGTHFRVGLGGTHVGAVGLAANTQFSGPQIAWYPKTPLCVTPGRGVVLFCRALVGTATATETFLWNVGIDGYFE